MTQIGNRISGRLLETLEVSLASTPTTGYAWEIMSCPPELEWLGEETRGVRSDLAGSPVEQVFRLRGHAIGTFSVTFGLRAPWTPSPAATRTIEVNITG